MKIILTACLFMASSLAYAQQATKPAEGTEKLSDADDSPIGLFIMPWRNATAEKDMDRPARLLEAEMGPIDRAVFERQVEYYDALEAHATKSVKTVKP